MRDHQPQTAPELAAIDVQGHTRQSFVLRGALAAGSVFGLSTVGPFVSRALAQGGDVEVLNFALTLEHLETAFYEQALERVGNLRGDAKELATTLRDNERDHVTALRKAIRQLGGKPVKAPKVKFGDAFADQASFLKLAQTLEDTGVGAYNGAAPLLRSKEILASAGSIVQVEARHAAAIRLLNDEPITPAAFDEALEQDKVLEAVKPFLAS